MPKKKSLQKLGFEAKTAIPSIILVSTPLIWYYAVNMVLRDSITKIATTSSAANIVWAAHYIGIIIAALVGACITKKTDQNKFLTSWMILGAISSLSVFLIYISSVLSLSLITLLLGISLGIGMPICMRCFNNQTTIEKRGRVSGIVLITFVAGAALMNFLPYDVVFMGVALVVLRLFSLAVFRLRPTSSYEYSKSKESTQSYWMILKQKSFILYFIPWVMFSLVNYLAVPIQSNLVGTQVVTDFRVIQTGLTGIFAVIGGYLSDHVGRRYVAITGFVIFGIGTSILAIFPQNILSWYISALSGGITFGFFYVIFILTIWGDLNGHFQSDKYYALGAMPFFASSFLGIVAGPYISELIPEYALFSFTAFFLFIAVFPLFIAPETLPEKVMKDRDLKSYVEKAKEKVQRETEKKQKKEDNKLKTYTKSRSGKIQENGIENEEALKLVEKYY